MEYEEYRAKVIECKRSGKNSWQWCTENGISHETYCTWRKRVSKKEGIEKINAECGVETAGRAAPKKYAEYREKVLECRGSGLTVEEWCRREDIKYNGYRTWQRSVAKREGLAAIDAECGRKVREKKDKTTELTQKKPKLYEISCGKREESDNGLHIKEGEGCITVQLGEWTVTGKGKGRGAVIKAVKRICC